jgi:molybdopterin/thiamine biosynthesis adenylyltransferase
MRYSRQEAFAGLGPEGQDRLRQARVLQVGCGALGSVLAETLVRAGVGHLTIADRDYVELGNLQRQTLFDEQDASAGRAKAAAAQARLGRLNSEVEVRGLVLDVWLENVDALVQDADLVLDGTDNLETRFFLNDVCLRRGVPWVYGACVGAHGLVLAVRPKVSPCLRCVLGERPEPGVLPTCETAGVVGPIVHVVAGVQAAEALKLLAGRDLDLLPGLFFADVWQGTFEVVDLSGRQPWCPACTEGRFEQTTVAPAELLCGSDAVQLRAEPGTKVDLCAVAARLAAAGEVVVNEHLLRFRAGQSELALFGDGRAIVKGVRDVGEARGLLARYVGV